MTYIIFRLICNLFDLCCINLCGTAKHWDSFLSDCRFQVDSGEHIFAKFMAGELGWGRKEARTSMKYALSCQSSEMWEDGKDQGHTRCHIETRQWVLGAHKRVIKRAHPCIAQPHGWCQVWTFSQCSVKQWFVAPGGGPLLTRWGR